jgi:hypothetical protein
LSDNNTINDGAPILERLLSYVLRKPDAEFLADLVSKSVTFVGILGIATGLNLLVQRLEQTSIHFKSLAEVADWCLYVGDFIWFIVYVVVSTIKAIWRLLTEMGVVALVVGSWNFLRQSVGKEKRVVCDQRGQSPAPDPRSSSPHHTFD